MGVTSKFLLQFLSECLLTERSALELYDLAISRTVDEGIKTQLGRYRDQTAGHLEAVERLITHFGGHLPTVREAIANVMNKLTAGLAAMQGTDQYQRWKDLDNVLLAEQRCHSNWEILRVVAEEIQDPQLAEAVAEIEAEEDVNVAWLQDRVLRKAPLAIAWS